jgi:hypothetical protein
MELLTSRQAHPDQRIFEPAGNMPMHGGRTWPPEHVGESPAAHGSAAREWPQCNGTVPENAGVHYSTHRHPRSTAAYLLRTPRVGQSPWRSRPLVSIATGSVWLGYGRLAPNNVWPSLASGTSFRALRWARAAPCPLWPVASRPASASRAGFFGRLGPVNANAGLLRSCAALQEATVEDRRPRRARSAPPAWSRPFRGRGRVSERRQPVVPRDSV